MAPSPERTIFISRAGTDAALAAQIGRVLQADGYHVILQQWDFANSSFINEMHEALRGGGRVIGLLSPAYLESDYCSAEWQAILAGDPLNRHRKLILLRVAECEPAGMLRAIAYWDAVHARDDAHALEELVRTAVQTSHRPEDAGDARLYRRPPILFDQDVLRGVPNFTGRDSELDWIQSAFESGAKAIAIHGLAGTGKSALASEYARRTRQRYAAIWGLSAETETGIIDGLIRFGVAFNPELENAPDRIDSARRVLTEIDAEFSTPVLLIFDNADDENLIRKWRPSAGAHVLVTTRLSAWSADVTTRELDSLPLDDAVTYLRRESGRDDLAPSDCRNIADALGCLPLALAQAAAYLKRTRNVTGRRYVEQLMRHLGTAPPGLPNERAIFATFQDAILKAEQEAPGAASVLCFAAFFAPDAIPEELLQQRLPIAGETLRPILPGATIAARDLGSVLGDDNALDEALGALDRLSLITFDTSERRFSMHRLVRTTSAHLLTEVHAAWLDYALAAAEAAFPRVTYETWLACERLLSHGIAVMQAAPQDLSSMSVARLARKCARYLRARAAFSDSEPLYRRALAIDQATYGPDHPEVASDLNSLALLLQGTNRLAEAEPLFRRALAIDEASYGPDHPNVATGLNNLALLLRDTNRLAEAEPLLRRALAIDQASYGPEHPQVATDLNNLALLLRDTNRLAEAEPLVRRALAIDEASYGPQHPRVANRLNNLASLLQDTNRLANAEPLFRRALTIDEASYGPNHPEVAIRLNNLASLLRETNRLAEAEPLFRRALAIDEASYGPQHPRVATDLNNLALLLRDTNRLAEAEPLFRRALAIDEASYGPEHPEVATDLNNFAALLQDTNRLAEAEPLVRRALAIDEASYGPQHPRVANRLTNLGSLLQDTNRPADAEPLLRRALAIDEASYGPEHPRVATDLNNLASLLQDTNRLADAEPLFRRALAIDEASYGPQHPRVANRLNNLASLLHNRNRLAEAEPLFRRALAIDEASYGPNHPTVGMIQTNLGVLLSKQTDDST